MHRSKKSGSDKFIQESNDTDAPYTPGPGDQAGAGELPMGGIKEGLPSFLILSFSLEAGRFEGKRGQIEEDEKNDARIKVLWGWG